MNCLCYSVCFWVVMLDTFNDTDEEKKGIKYPVVYTQQMKELSLLTNILSKFLNVNLCSFHNLVFGVIRVKFCPVCPPFLEVTKGLTTVFYMFF